MRRILPFALAPVLLLASCNDMILQPKRDSYRAASVGPGPVPPGMIGYLDKPTVPPPLTYALIKHGQERFRQFCVPCHSELGDGQGMVVHRGFSPPPNYAIARLVNGPTTHFYDVITHGYGAMYSFAERVPPYDRWAIAAYIRALQKSATGRLADLPADQRASLP